MPGFTGNQVRWSDEVAGVTAGGGEWSDKGDTESGCIVCLKTNLGFIGCTVLI